MALVFPYTAIDTSDFTLLTKIHPTCLQTVTLVTPVYLRNNGKCSDDRPLGHYTV